jgi:hypothetical protein
MVAIIQMCLLSPPEMIHSRKISTPKHIVDCDDRFINIVAKWPGSSHDSRVFKESAVYRNLENNNIDGYLLGDSGLCM